MTVISPISNVVIAVVYIGSGVGVVIAIICLSFNIIFRNRKYVVYSLLSLFKILFFLVDTAIVF